VALATTQAFSHYKKSYPDCYLQHFFEFGDIFSFGRCLRPTSNIFRNAVTQRVDSDEFKGHISLVMKSRLLFHSQFCMRFSGMDICTKTTNLLSMLKSLGVLKKLSTLQWRQCLHC